MEKTKKHTYNHHDDRPYSRDSKSGRDDRNKDKDRGYDRRRIDNDSDDDHDRNYKNRDNKSQQYNNRNRDQYRNDRAKNDYKRVREKSKQTNRSNNNEKYEWGKEEDRKKDSKKANDKDEEAIPKEQPSLEPSGNLAKDTNMYNGVVIKYNEPTEARKPRKRWRLYVFKGEEELPHYQIHRQSAYLFGRERKIADIPVDHPSCSKQHAVFQYRMVSFKKPDGRNAFAIKPYIIDLGSTNGTYINNERIEPQRYYELKEKDVIKFGFSSREYVLLHEESKATDDEDEVNSQNNDSSDENNSEDDLEAKRLEVQRQKKKADEAGGAGGDSDDD